MNPDELRREANRLRLVADLNGARDWENNAEMVIPTLEGRMHATPGDWIIRGVQGEFYPCKPDIFEKTYEASEQAEDIDRMGPAANCHLCVGAGGYEDYDGEWRDCSCQLDTPSGTP